MDPCSLEGKPLTVAAAAAAITAAIRPVAETETVALAQALGRVLAEPVRSPIDLPPERNAAMDGFALTATPPPSSPLAIVGTSWAGKPFAGRVRPGECVRIFTGAVVPAGADTVVMQEQVRVVGDRAEVQGPVKPGQNVRAAGEDVRQGGLLVGRGKPLAAADLALLAAAGVGEVAVRRRPRVIFFSTGDELTAVGTALATGKIYDSNRYLLGGLLANPAYQATDGGLLADDPEQLAAALAAAAQRHDAIITTGGASVGDADHVYAVLARLGRVGFWKVAMKPGKPVAFGHIGGCAFFGLPGNPAAVLVSFQQLVAPGLRQLAAMAAKPALRLAAVCATPLKKSPGREEFQRGLLRQGGDGGLEVAAAGQQGSHLLGSLAAANCLIVLPAACGGVAAGDTVLVELLPPLP